MELWQALVLAFVEGVTEYLPISSTGHLVLCATLMKIESAAFTRDYIVVVQFGAILAAVCIYFDRLKGGIEIWKKLFFAFLPTAVVGFALKNVVDAWLDSALIVGLSTFLGGLVLLIVDRFFNKPRYKDSKRIPTTRAFMIGLVQCLALVPGTSRSAASILGGLMAGLSRPAAAEFSFLLAIPTLSAAATYKVFKIYQAGSLQHDWTLIVLGNIASFIFGYITIRAFIGFLSKNGFFWFGVYRALLGGFILALLASGYSLHL